MAPLIVGAVALAEDMYQMYATRRMIETSDTPRIIAVMGVTGAGKSTCIQKVNGLNPSLDACTNYHYGCSTPRNSLLQPILAFNSPGTQ